MVNFLSNPRATIRSAAQLGARAKAKPKARFKASPKTRTSISLTSRLSEPLRALSLALFPPLCRLCGDSGGEAGTMDLCHACQRSLPWNNCACPHCALPLHPGEAMCHCHSGPWPFSRVSIPLVYETSVTSLISGFKYHSRLPDGQLLGKLLAEHLKASQQRLPVHVVPLPLHPQRLRQRGFEQTIELARALSRELPGLTTAPILQRCRATPKQSHLAAQQRRKNVHGAFVIAPRAPVPKHVALLDDVVTTGATALAAAQALFDGGVSRVDLWAVARAVKY